MLNNSKKYNFRTDRTNIDRWKEVNSYKNWNRRSDALMQLFMKFEYNKQSKYQIIEYGCGPQAPFYNSYNRHSQFEVIKYDIKAWDDQTNIIDLNESEITLPNTNISVFSGVLEYLNDVPSILQKAIAVSDYVLITYNFVHADWLNNDVQFIRRIRHRAIKNGWRNHYTNKDIVQLVSSMGILCAAATFENSSCFLIRNNVVNSGK